MFLRGVLLLVFLLLAPQALGAISDFKISVFSTSDSFLTDTVISFHTSGKTQATTQIAYVFTLFFEDETNPIVVFPASYFFPKTNYTYKTSGQKKVRALASVNNLSSIRTNQSWKDFFKNNAAQILAMTMVSFQVHESSACFTYDINTNWEPAVNASLSAAAQVSNYVTFAVTLKLEKNGPSGFDAKSLSSVFIGMSEPPDSFIFNDTNRLPVVLETDFQLNRWVASVPKLFMESATTMRFKIFGVYSSVLSCQVEDKVVDVGRPYLRQQAPGITISSQPRYNPFGSSLEPSDIQYYCDPCSRQNALVLVRPKKNANLNYGGGTYLASSDGFSFNYLVKDLLRDSDGNLIPGGKWCARLDSTRCRNIQIVDIALVSKNVFILASSGLFLLRKLISGNDSVIAIRSSLEGNLAGAVYAPENTFMKHSPNCLYPQISYIFWSFGDSALTALKTVVFSTLADVTNGVWSESRTARNFSLKDTTTFIDFERDHDTDSNLYLIGDPCGRTDLRRCGVGVSIIVENIVRGFRSSYSFPATLIFTGLSFHSNGVDVFAYGNELWHSIDRGLTWRKSFTPFDRKPSTIITQFRSFGYADDFFLTTLDKKLFYSRVASKDIAEIPELKFQETEYFEVSANEDKTYFTISVGADSNVEGSTSVWPLTSNVFLKKKAIPLKASLENVDESFAANLLYIPTGKRTFQLALTSSIGVQMGSERLIGYNLFHKNGGFGSITSVNSDGNLFEGFDIEPFQPEPVTVSPSLQYELQIEASSFSSPPQGSVTLFPVSLTITRLPSLAEGWRFSDIGNSVFSSFTGIMIDRIASSTLAYGFSSSPIQGTVRWQPGSWSIIDFAAVQDLAYNARQALTVTTSTATLATATLDTGSFVFNDNHVGSFLSTTLGVGIIASVESSTQIQIHMIPNIVELSKGTMSSLRLGSIPAGSWSLSTLSEKYDFSDESMIRSRAWKLVLSECTVRRSNAGPTQYLKFYGNTSLMNEIQVDDLNALNPLNAYLNIAFSNSTLYSSNISIERNYHKKNAKVQISLKNKGSQGQAVIAYRSAPETLKCPPTQSSVRIVSSCPPTRLLKFTTYLNPKDSFKANITISANVEKETLPVNYRPPSFLGRSVPISQNFYNSDPSSPKHRNRYDVSKRSGQYKRCELGKSRQSCNCNEEDAISMKIADSDCIEKVATTFYEKPFTPTFAVFQYGQWLESLQSKYRLIELNNRTDYCLSVMPNCRNKTALYDFMDPLNNDTITWEGPELYHFRAEIVEKEYCLLSVDFSVYVTVPVPRTAIVLTTMSVASVIFGFCLLVIYLLYFFRQTNV